MDLNKLAEQVEKEVVEAMDGGEVGVSDIILAALERVATEAAAEEAAVWAADKLTNTVVYQSVPVDPAAPDGPAYILKNGQLVVAGIAAYVSSYVAWRFIVEFHIPEYLNAGATVTLNHEEQIATVQW